MIKKDNQVIIRCTDRQKQIIKELADKEEMTISAFIMQLVMECSGKGESNGKQA